MGNLGTRMMAQQSATQTPPDALASYSEPPERKGEHFTHAELGLILAFNAEGKTQTEIAQRLGRSQVAVSKALRRLGTDTAQLAKHHLAARSFKAARRVTRIAETSANEGEALKAAKFVLQANGIGQSNQQVTVNTAVMIAQPDRPETWGPGPSFLEAKVVSERASAGDDKAQP
jgi:ParB-like chromosome segregation protein Spo0J